MMLDNMVFNKTDFWIQDTSLFSTSSLSTGRVHIELTSSANSFNNQNVLMMGPICLEYYLIPTNCSICTVNTTYEQCWDEYYNAPDPNSSGGGGGGSGNGGGAGSGWSSDPINPEVLTVNWFNSQPNYLINFRGLSDYPCVQEIAQDVLNLTNSTIQIVQRIFSQSTKYNISFTVDPNLNVPGSTSSTPGYYRIEDGSLRGLAYLNINIKINPNHIQSATKLSIAHTIIHELIHAYFNYRSIEAQGNTVKEELLAQELGFLKPYDPNAPVSTYGNQHEQMAALFIENISNALREYKLLSNSDLSAIQALYPSVDLNTYYTALSWAGLTGDINGYVTKAWENFEITNPGLAAIYKVIITAEQNRTPLAASQENCQ